MVEFPLQSPVENLQLIAREIVSGFLIGLHRSPFHGFSVEFSEHRLYNPGDNLRYVDWKVYGRTDRMFIKKFEEETNLRCYLAIDTSSSMYYPAEGVSKLAYSCVAAASLGWLLKKQLDAQSLALFDEELYFLSPAKTGWRQQKFITNELERLLRTPKSMVPTNLPHSLHQLADRLHQRSLVVVFSDIPESPEKAEALVSALQHLKFNKHEVIVFHVIHGAKELDFDFEDRPYRLEDPETGQAYQLNPFQYKEAYREAMNAYLSFLETETQKLEIDLVFSDMRQAPIELLRRYLVRRQKFG